VKATFVTIIVCAIFIMLAVGVQNVSGSLGSSISSNCTHPINAYDTVQFDVEASDGTHP